MLGCCSTPAVTPSHKHYKFAYFNARGVGETCRFLLAMAKTDFEDFRYNLTFEKPGDFSTIKRPEFDAAKAAGELDVSLGKVPYLEVEGVKVAQSKAIERFLAREFGFMGANSVEAAQIDQMCEHIIDFKNAYQKAKGIKDEDEKKAAVEKWFSTDLPGLVQSAEKSLPPGAPGSPWLVGSKVSLADVAWFQFLAAPKGFFDNVEGAKAAFEPCPRIKAALEAVGKIPEVQEWIRTRPDTMF